MKDIPVAGSFFPSLAPIPRALTALLSKTIAQKKSLCASRLPYLFTGEICEISQYTFTSRYRSPQIPTKSSAKLKPGFDGRRPCDHQSDLMAFASVLTLRRKQTGVNRNELDYSIGLNLRCMNGIRSSLILASVINAPIDVERTAKPFRRIWFTPSRNTDAKIIKRPL